MTIRMLITKLDGSDRKFEVIKLRRLEADYVAGSIEFMMGVGDKKKNNRPSPYEYMFGMRMPEPEDESKKFRVDAVKSNVKKDKMGNIIKAAVKPGAAKT